MKRYNTFFEPRSKYLHAIVRGFDLDPKIELSYLSDVISECRKQKYARILIEKDIPKKLTNDEVIEVACKFASMDVADLKIAFVDQPQDGLSQSPFISLVARNRGINAEAFDGVGKAEHWLLS